MRPIGRLPQGKAHPVFGDGHSTALATRSPFSANVRQGLSEASCGIGAERGNGKKNEDNNVDADVKPHTEPRGGRGF